MIQQFPSELRHRLDLAKNPDIIENFHASLSNEIAELLGKKIPVGEAQIIIPKAKIDLHKLEDGLSGGNASIPMEVWAVPEDSPARVVYRNWISSKK